MNRNFLQHAFCFLAGLVGASIFLGMNPAKVEQFPPRAVYSPPAEEFEPFLTPRAADAKQEFRDVKELQRLMDTALPVIRACAPEERAARWYLLLAQLRREEDAGLAVIASFLATGEDLPIGNRIDLPGLKLRGASTLRMAALDQVNGMNGPDIKQIQIDGNLQSLRLGKSAFDVVRLIRNLEHFDPGKHREDAIAAMQRAANSEANASSSIAQVIAHFGATELLPLAEKKAIGEQEDGAFNDLFGALWKVPAEEREQVTSRTLRRPDIMAANMAGAVDKLDYRIPAAREYAVAWFSSEQPIARKADAIERLGSAAGFGPRFSFPTDDWNPNSAVGTPGTVAQAEARLALLEQIEGLRSEPLLQERILSTRRVLEEQVAAGK